MFDCCKSDNRSDTGVKGSINGAAAIDAPQFKIENYKSTKLTPEYYKTLPEPEKDAILAEAFKILMATVEPSKIPPTSNPIIKQMLTKMIVSNVKTPQGTYDGESIHGVANGKGKLVSSDGFTVYEGEFFNGFRHGVGKVVTTHEDGSTLTYEGRFHKGELVSAVEVKTNGLKDDNWKAVSYLRADKMEGPFILEFPATKDLAYGCTVGDKYSGDVIFLNKGQPKQSITLSSYKKEGSDEPVSEKEFEEIPLAAPQPTGTAPQHGGAAPQAGGNPSPQNGQPPQPNNAAPAPKK